MIISSDILAKTCKDMIETILFCLADATKGTVYRVGPMPDLQVIRVTSGLRNGATGEIRWGLPEVSDYNYPGKTWEQYKDRSGHVLEAMGWCVERQKSWTSDNPPEDLRSVRKQLGGEPEDYHHMEPVLVKKSYFYGDDLQCLEYPKDHAGKPVWKDCDYVVVAVVKIHFKPGRIKRGDNSTKIIKKLSRTLGTELLSLHIRETLSDAQKELARQRLQSCNVLAHEFRNTLIKLGFIFSAINTEISYLREQWEAQLEKAFPHLENKKTIIARLSRLIEERLPDVNGKRELTHLTRDLLEAQQEMISLALLPQIGEKWIDNRIRPKWERLLGASPVWESDRSEIEQLLGRLAKCIWMGTDEALAGKVDHLSPHLRAQWPKLAYVDFSVDKMIVLQEILEFLENPELDIPHKHQTKKILTSLKALAEMIPEVEEKANRIICSLRNGDLRDTI